MTARAKRSRVRKNWDMSVYAKWGRDVMARGRPGLPIMAGEGTLMEHKRKPNSYIYVDTPCGRIKGLRTGMCLMFKGVPYASAGRWEDPEVVRHWDGAYDATGPGAHCCQYLQFYPRYEEGFNAFYYDQYADKELFRYSEKDGLNLNIWTREGAKDLPVAVFFHGGSFQTGGNNTGNICRGEGYCERGVVLVSANYRLNAFATGWDETHRGNYAIKDQIAALTWVQKNIRAFGGDPDRVTVMGNSAGAMSVQLLLYSPYAKGLFHRAVMMSGGGDLTARGVPARPEWDQKIWQLVMERYGAQRLEQLKDLPAKELFDTWTQVCSMDPGTYAHRAYPVIDGDVIPAEPAELRKTGRVTDVPCIIGITSRDMIPELLYGAALDWAVYHAENGRSPVYGYYMDRPAPGDDAGAYHGCDLWYAFGTLDRSWRPYEELDWQLSDQMLDYFTGFIKDGTPHADGLAEWLPMEGKDARFLRFSDEPPIMFQPQEAPFADSIRHG